MNASTAGIAVIQARLPYTDRRALSQAWLSALHLASENAGEARARASAPPSEESLGAPLSRTLQKDAYPEKQGGAAMVWRTPPPVRRQGECGAAFYPERSRVRRSGAPAVLSQESESGSISHLRFTMTVAGARTALHVRRQGGKVIVIAVCSARHAELVRRALAEAAAAMRSQGESVDMAVRAVDGEERA